MDQRKDRLTELFIDAALHTSRTHGYATAEMVMREHGVSREAIVRMLILGKRRRSAQAKHGYLHWLFGGDKVG